MFVEFAEYSSSLSLRDHLLAKKLLQESIYG